MGYVKPGNGWKNSSLVKSNIACMAVCEVCVLAYLRWFGAHHSFVLQVINDPAHRVTSTVPGGSKVEGFHEYVCDDVRSVFTSVRFVLG